MRQYNTGKQVLAVLALFASACQGSYRGEVANEPQFSVDPIEDPGTIVPDLNPTISGLDFIVMGRDDGWFENQDEPGLYGIMTDQTLKVRITPGNPMSIYTESCPSGNLEDCRYTPVVGCVSYDITVAGRTVTTPPLKVPGTPTSPLCTNAVTEMVYDFSSQLAPGHGAVSLTVSEARYDELCQQALKCEKQWTWGCYYIDKQQACSSMRPLHDYTNPDTGDRSAHRVRGYIDLELDGTDAI